ncbi:MAG: outer membrane beta-barrel protein [Prolixibacteraceae bacterium]
MQNNEHKIDELFQSKLAGFEAVPPSEVWDQIAASMGHTKKRRKAILIWSFSGAASLLLAFLMGWVLAGRTSLNLDQQFTAELEHYRSQQSPMPISEPIVNEQLVVHFNQTPFIPAEGLQPKTQNKSFMEERQKLIPDALAHLTSIKTSLDAQLYGFPNLATSKEEELFTAADRKLIEANLLAMEEGKEKEANGNWALGVNASPVYRFNQPQMGKMDAAQAFDVVQNQVPSTYQTNLSGGLTFAYETTSRIDIISGVNYSEVAQNTGDVALSFLGHNWINDTDEMNYAIASSKEATSAINTSNNMVINTQVGLSNITLPEGATAATARAMTSLVPVATQNYDYKQQARYIEVPLLMRYRIIDKRLGWNVLGGINSNILVANTVQIIDQSTVVATSKIEDLRPLTWSSSLGMGLNYDLTEHLNLNFEPTLKIQLNSLNSQSYFNAKPYSFGVFSGVSYRF